ncbi:permease [Kordiimonas sediminis]|uniref:Permease n=1 Tax=Kordiimonas sediminis TaxID=1735581 RepID=A0A919APZ8_9PROT|nr:ABC transporter permease [Kordiimonas sediminis]GHF20923.1 permease [Kordiimonas sediminis]
MILRRHIFERILGLFRPLDRKLFRGVRGLGAQVIAVSVVVACGVTLFITMNGTVTSLSTTRDTYYDRYNMAHIWAPVKRAPMVLRDQISDIPGVRRARGRISAGALVDMPGEPAPVRGKVLSIPDGRMPDVNTLYLKRGTLPRKGREEVILLDSFVQAHKLQLGDTIPVTLYGAKRFLRIVGVALSPEFVYSIPPGELVPDPKRNAVMWMGYDALAHAYNMDGAFNEIVLLTERGASEQDIMRRIDILLEPYGGIGSYSRDNHISDEFIKSELTQLSVVGSIIPPIFLGVAAFLLNIIITRIVEDEREQIGLLKAFGYTQTQIAMHYLKFALIIISIGVFLGWAGGERMGRGTANMYQEFYHFPLLIFNPGIGIFIEATLFALLAGVLGVFLAVRKIIGLRPAVAMSPPPPTDYSGVVSFGGKLKWMDQTLRLIVRHILRWPLRAALTCLGISMGMALMIGARGNVDALDKMMMLNFEQVSRQDLTVSFTETQDRSIVNEMGHIDGVLAVEPFLSVPVTLKNKHHIRHKAITGVVLNAQQNLLLDRQERQINPPADGLVMEELLAEALDVKAGDTVTVKVKTGNRPELEVPVLRIIKTYLGTPVYMEMHSLHSYLRNGEEISGVYLTIDESKEDAIFKELKDMPGVLGVNSNNDTYRAMRKTMDQAIGTMLVLNSTFASLIAIGVVYSSARISFFERQREIASLRVLGFTLTEVNMVLLGELAILTVFALPLGVGLGRLLAQTMAHEMSSELFRMPSVVELSTLGSAAAIILIASILSAALMSRRVAKLDMIIALKTKE